MATVRDREVSGKDMDEEPPQPGIAIVWSGDAPTLMTFPVGAGGLVLGRELLGGVTTDDRISRQHARLRWHPPSFSVIDLGSRNGTFVGGQPVVDGEITVMPPCVVRTGRTVGILLDDLGPIDGAEVGASDDEVVGPTLAPVWARIAREAAHSDTLLVEGEPGTGKELAARAFHRASGATGELLTLDCAALPAGEAERLLFGAVPGAPDAALAPDGYVVAADGGTLVLDDIGALEPAAQTRLARVLATRAVQAPGATGARAVSLRLVATSQRDLRAEVAAGRIRDDLAHHLRRLEVRIPPLRERLEDVPWLVAREVGRATPELGVHSTMVEACLLRPWPGNVRELIGEVRRAAYTARDAGKKVVRSEDLDASAGMILEGMLGPPTIDLQAQVTAPMLGMRPTGALPVPDAIVAALRLERGNVTRAARTLGVSRSQLRRFLARNPDVAELAQAEPDGVE